MNKEAVVLGALLHDIGKFWWRAERPRLNHPEAGAAFIDEIQDLFPYDWLDDIRDAVGNHHAPARKEIEKIVKVADCLASKERKKEIGLERMEPDETPLLSIASQVDIFERPHTHWWFRLNQLKLERDVIFPAEAVQVSSSVYQPLWEDFRNKIGRMDKITSLNKLLPLLSLLRKYTSFIPAATPWEEDEEYRTRPDIPLFDHSKLTAAIAACLYYLLLDHVEALLRGERDDEPVCLMLRADISGIQNFIYRIARPSLDAEAKGTARRLRGRSFYISLLSDVIADWFVRKLDLPITNILFCGGGRFDLLIPCKKEEEAKHFGTEIDKWLVKEFYGELGIQFASRPLHPGDFGELKSAYDELEDELAWKKQRKFRGLLDGDFFHKEISGKVCKVCHINPSDEICNLCDRHLKIGGDIPKSDHIAFVYGGSGDIPFPPPIDVAARLLEEGEAHRFLEEARNQNLEVMLYRLNDTEFLMDAVPAQVSLGFKFLGNQAPMMDGEVLDFEEIASLSTGARLLGILKADVDNLGYIFSTGIEDMSISRLSTLSNYIDIFFSGWLNKICDDVSNKWKKELPQGDPRREKVQGNIFYITYSGGDDLFIIGPWDQVIELAIRLYKDFRKYTCQNPDITLSAGILLVKPTFPIQRFAYLVGEELGRSKKKKEKDSITIFKDTVRWFGEDGFEELINLGKDWAKKVEDGKMPKSFVYFLKKLHDQHFDEEGQNCLWVPKLHYAAARRLKKEVMEDVMPDISPKVMKHIQIPVSYVSLITRKE